MTMKEMNDALMALADTYRIPHVIGDYRMITPEEIAQADYRRLLEDRGIIERPRRSW